MKPGYDNQNRHGVWPNPVDTPLDRARRIAGMYRHHLNAIAPDTCAELDATAVGFGETWMLDRPDVVDPDRELTTAEAADLVRAHPDVIRKWACTKHPTAPDVMLLPRFGWRGRERTYIARKVLEAAALIRKGQHAR